MVKRTAAALIVLAASAGGLAACSASEPLPAVTVTETTYITITASPLTDIVGAVTGGEDTFVMPTLIGMDLQEAQDVLQAMGSLRLDQQDASGEGRNQILDRNWKVCAQVPEPSTVHPKADEVRLESVKDDETCP